MGLLALGLFGAWAHPVLGTYSAQHKKVAEWPPVTQMDKPIAVDQVNKEAIGHPKHEIQPPRGIGRPPREI